MSGKCIELNRNDFVTRVSIPISVLKCSGYIDKFDYLYGVNLTGPSAAWTGAWRPFLLPPDM